MNSLQTLDSFGLLLEGFTFEYNNQTYVIAGGRGSWNTYVRSFLQQISGKIADKDIVSEFTIREAGYIVRNSNLSEEQKERWAKALSNFASDFINPDTVIIWLKEYLNVPGDVAGNTIGNIMKPLLIGVGIVAVIGIALVYSTGKQGLSYKGVKIGK